MSGSKEQSDAIATNLAAWEEAAPHHRARYHDYLLKLFAQPGFSSLRGARQQGIDLIGVAGKAVAQLCCNNGREILSIKNLGAGRCVGFDMSEAFVAQARELAAVGGIDCEFVVGDVLGLSDDYNNSFDLVVVTVGTLRWMPDLRAFMNVVARLLKPGGEVFINEMHPLLDVFRQDPKGQVEWARSYFDHGPVESRVGLAYEDVEDYEATAHIWYHYTLSDLMTAVLDCRLQVLMFKELQENISGAYKYLAPAGVRPPMSYVMIARKSVPG